MHIIVISNLSQNLAAGLNWSVPARVAAFEKFADVYWLNLTNCELPHWRTASSFHNISELGGKFSLKTLPQTFQNPDVVIFEGFYHPRDPLIAWKLRRKGIPYIIVPRGSLTPYAQHIGSIFKRAKKLIANTLIFKPYTRNALALQYLAPDEQRLSGNSWCRDSFIVPNGCHLPSSRRTNFSKDGIKAIFIGRLDYYVKGLDCLLNGISANSDLLRKARFTLDIYGPLRNYGYSKVVDIIQNIEKNNIGDIVRLKGEVSGQDKEHALMNSDLFILTSRTEGLPMGLVEALSYGLPVLVTPGTNMSQQIEDASCGWVCQSTPQSVGNALCDIVMNKDSFASKGEKAYLFAKQNTWEVLAEKFIDEIRSRIGKQTNNKNR